MRYFVFLAIILSTCQLKADVCGNVPFTGTIAGGYWAGEGIRAAGHAEFLRGLGRYQIDHQEAFGLSIENRNKQIDLQQRLKSINKDEFDATHPDFITRETKRLDDIEKRTALREREYRMMREGKIAPRPEPSIVIRGRQYKTVAEWKETQDYQLSLLERQQKDLEDTIKGLREEEYRRDGIVFLRQWDRMSSLEKDTYSRHERMKEDGYDKDGRGNEINLHAKHGNYPELEDQINIYTKLLMSVFHQEDILRASMR